MKNSKKDKFNKVKYDNEYIKNNYKRMNLLFKPEIAQEIEDYCTSRNISKSQFIAKAALYYINNEIDIEGLKQL